MSTPEEKARALLAANLVRLGVATFEVFRGGGFDFSGMYSEPTTLLCHLGHAVARVCHDHGIPLPEEIERWRGHALERGYDFDNDEAPIP